MTKFYDANPPYVKADDDKVLCDGLSKTSVGGCVYSMDTDALDTWQEMTEAEADVLIAAAVVDEEATEADYQEALNELGVTFDEEV